MSIAQDGAMLTELSGQIERITYTNEENGFTIAIRPSGTEPKIKYYLFGCGEKNALDLLESKKQVSLQVKEISEWLVEDANKRIA